MGGKSAIQLEALLCLVFVSLVTADFVNSANIGSYTTDNLTCTVDDAKTWLNCTYQVPSQVWVAIGYSTTGFMTNAFAIVAGSDTGDGPRILASHDVGTTT